MPVLHRCGSIWLFFFRSLVYPVRINKVKSCTLDIIISIIIVIIEKARGTPNRIDRIALKRLTETTPSASKLIKSPEQLAALLVDDGAKE